MRGLPEDVLAKPPSAELRPGQTDQDELPPYDILDGILRLYIEERMDVDAITERTGAHSRLVLDILRRVVRHKYKRAQAPPVLRITRKALGIDRRMPLHRA